MAICCCSLAGTAACRTCSNNPNAETPPPVRTYTTFVTDPVEEPKECKVCMNNGNDYCFVCDNGNQFKPLTNADRIRSMSDEELAEWLYDWAGGAPNCDRELGEKPDYKSCRDCWMAWLKAKVEEVDDG